MRVSLPFFALLCATALGAGLHAQSDHSIRVRLLDGKTGEPVDADNYLVRIDRDETVHNEWVQINSDKTVVVTLPADAREIAIKATYDMSMQTYIDCDIAKESDKERDVWYPVSEILQSGLVAPNECSKTHYKAKPGEFVFFVRKRSWREVDR